MARKRTVSSIITIAVLLSISSMADTWTVDDDGKADFDTIQSAVDAATDGDEIIIMQGTYTSEQDGHVVNTLGKTITLRSNDPSNPDIVAATIIDGEGERRGIACFNGETNYTRFRGITISNGYSEDYDYNNNGAIELFETAGGGMYCLGSSPSISDCVFSDNFGTIGGGIFCDAGSHATIDSTTIRNNTANNYGGGMSCFLSNPEISSTIFQSNTSLKYGAGGLSCYMSDPAINACTFIGNSANVNGGAMLCLIANPILTGCIFENNTAREFGGAVFCDFGMPRLIDCILRSNSAKRGGGMNEATFSEPYLVGTTVCANTPDQITGDWVDGGDNIVSDTCPVDCPDIDGDELVGVADLLAVIDDWGTSNSPADVNDDAIVDVLDLLLVVGNWGPCTN